MPGSIAIWVVSIFTTLAGAGPATSKDKCTEIVKQGSSLHDKGKYAEAVEIYKKGLKLCGDGFGFSNEIGFSLAAQKQYDRAADAFIEEILHPPAPAVAFGNLFAIFGKLSKKAQDKLAATGSAAAKPIYVPTIGMEYGWLGHISCRGKKAKHIRQSLMSYKGHQLDRQEYECPDGTRGKAYFDFSADPTEQALQKELQKMSH